MTDTPTCEMNEIAPRTAIGRSISRSGAITPLPLGSRTAAAYRAGVSEPRR